VVADHMYPIGLAGVFSCEQSLLVVREELALIMKSASNKFCNDGFRNK
jgi:hypothetical protein